MKEESEYDKDCSVTMNGIEDLKKALDELVKKGYIESRISPSTGERSYTVTEKIFDDEDFSEKDLENFDD